MTRRFIAMVTLLWTTTTLACGLHQSTGFTIVSEEGSLEVFARIIDSRKSNQFNNAAKPDHFKLFAFKSALDKDYPHKMDFSVFEAVKGHYSRVSMTEGAHIAGLEILPTESDILVITEWDVLDAMATGVLSWQQAKAEGLIRLNGPEAKKHHIEAWFNAAFPE